MRTSMLLVVFALACVGCGNPKAPGPLGSVDLSGRWHFRGELGGAEALWILNLSHEKDATTFTGTSRFEWRGGRHVVDLLDGQVTRRAVHFRVAESRSGSITFYEKTFDGELTLDGTRIDGEVRVNDQLLYISFTRVPKAPRLAAQWVVTDGTEQNDSHGLWGLSDSALVVKSGGENRLLDTATGATLATALLAGESGGQTEPVTRPYFSSAGPGTAAFYGIAGRPSMNYPELSALVRAGASETRTVLAPVGTDLRGGRGFFGVMTSAGAVTGLFDANFAHVSEYDFVKLLPRPSQGDFLVVTEKTVLRFDSTSGALGRWNFDQGGLALVRTAAIGPDGKLVIFGELNGSTTLGEGASAVAVQGGSFVACYSPQNELLWVATKASGGEPLSASALAMTEAGEVYAIGSGPARTVFKLDASGAIAWQAQTSLGANPAPWLAVVPEGVLAMQTVQSGVYEAGSAVQDVETAVLFLDGATGATGGIYSAPFAYALASNASGDLFLSAEFEGTVRVWDGEREQAYTSVGGRDTLAARVRWPWAGAATAAGDWHSTSHSERTAQLPVKRCPCSRWSFRSI